MAKFIELTGALTGKKKMLNMDDISVFGTDNDGDTKLVFTNGQDFCVKESYDQVKAMLEVK